MYGYNQPPNYPQPYPQHTHHPPPCPQHATYQQPRPQYPIHQRHYSQHTNYPQHHPQYPIHQQPPPQQPYLQYPIHQQVHPQQPHVGSVPPGSNHYQQVPVQLRPRPRPQDQRTFDYAAKSPNYNPREGLASLYNTARIYDERSRCHLHTSRTDDYDHASSQGEEYSSDSQDDDDAAKTHEPDEEYYSHSQDGDDAAKSHQPRKMDRLKTCPLCGHRFDTTQPGRSNSCEHSGHRSRSRRYIVGIKLYFGDVAINDGRFRESMMHEFQQLIQSSGASIARGDVLAKSTVFDSFEKEALDGIFYFSRGVEEAKIANRRTGQAEKNRIYFEGDFYSERIFTLFSLATKNLIKSATEIHSRSKGGDGSWDTILRYKYEPLGQNGRLLHPISDH